ncbi:uncharacterized protein LOC142012230 [Carettochelys insculpta]|uniref:uncharacterized protein LOC142012230 n=1 Tax=Carettochelys insculpta TaxID=44489 RepID=UPI003EBC3317
MAHGSGLLLVNLTPRGSSMGSGREGFAPGGEQPVLPPPTETPTPSAEPNGTFRQLSGFRGDMGASFALLVALSVAVGALVAVALWYVQGQRTLRETEEAVHKIRLSLQPNATGDTSKELASLELLGEVQAGVRMLQEQLGNASAANRELQVRLDTVSAPRAAVQDCCSESQLQCRLHYLWNDANCTLPARWICKQVQGQAGL